MISVIAGLSFNSKANLVEVANFIFSLTSTIAEEDIVVHFIIITKVRVLGVVLCFEAGSYEWLDRMSDAGDEIQVDAPAAEVEVSTEAPKGKLSVEDALQVRISLLERWTWF